MSSVPVLVLLWQIIRVHQKNIRERKVNERHNI